MLLPADSISRMLLGRLLLTIPRQDNKTNKKPLSTIYIEISFARIGSLESTLSGRDMFSKM